MSVVTVGDKNSIKSITYCLSPIFACQNAKNACKSAMECHNHHISTALLADDPSLYSAKTSVQARGMQSLGFLLQVTPAISRFIAWSARVNADDSLGLPMPDDETATADVRRPGGMPGSTRSGIFSIRYARLQRRECCDVLVMRSGDAQIVS